LEKTIIFPFRFFKDPLRNLILEESIDNQKFLFFEEGLKRFKSGLKQKLEIKNYARKIIKRFKNWNNGSRNGWRNIEKIYRGYGGRCLPKDTKALIQFADSKGIDLKLLKIVEKINSQLMAEQGIEDPEKFSKRE